ncbi:hypothetical protein [Ornithinibacillus sp. 179-J 7C1 HS]|uniref:hypothetical protein n=1 Tax=Ornithinibacillus sp. 179-J 7C1 HS TaxID=3142384 RepID=UPI00399FE727
MKKNPEERIQSSSRRERSVDADDISKEERQNSNVLESTIEQAYPRIKHILELIRKIYNHSTFPCYDIPLILV